VAIVDEEDEETRVDLAKVRDVPDVLEIYDVPQDE